MKTASGIYVRHWEITTSYGWGTSVHAKAMLSNQDALVPLSSLSLLGRFEGFGAPIPPHPQFPQTNPHALLLQETVKSALASPKAKDFLEKDAPIGVYVGTTGGLFWTEEPGMVSGHQLPSVHHIKEHFLARSNGCLAAQLQSELGLWGPTATLNTACTSASNALQVAWDALKLGIIKKAVVIGFEPLLNLTIAGFQSLLLYDRKKCEPFSKNRNGMNLGAGCGVILLEASKKSPQCEGISVEFIASHNKNDNTNPTSSDPTGQKFCQHLSEMFDSAGASRQEVVGVKAHGTATRDNDLAEGLGLKSFFSQYPLPHIASLKAYIGHTLGASGVVDLALWLTCLESGFLPASRGFVEECPDIGLMPACSRWDSPPSGLHLFHSFGFGGSVSTQLFQVVAP